MEELIASQLQLTVSHLCNRSFFPPGKPVFHELVIIQLLRCNLRRKNEWVAMPTSWNVCGRTLIWH